MLDRILGKGGLWTQEREMAFRTERLAQVSKGKKWLLVRETAKLICSQMFGRLGLA